ncbi:MAG: BamA/TamA family outer membrane protein [Vicinamibacterales bacterium]
MRTLGPLSLLSLLIAGVAAPAAAQPQPSTREAEIAAAQSEKAQALEPYEPSRGEALVIKAEEFLNNTFRYWHPYLTPAYQGGGFAPGAGYTFYTSPFTTLDLRGSYSVRSYKKAEAEFSAPRLLSRRASLSIAAGWREATQVAFFGLGRDSREGDRTNFGFEQPYVSASFSVRPARKVLTLEGGAEWTQWKTRAASGGRAPSIETRYAADDLPGLGADVTYLHAQGKVALDWRPEPGYARRGTYLGVAAHEYRDTDNRYGFRQMDYDVVQHVPILREAWVVSLHGQLTQTDAKHGQEVPYFLRPWLGGGTTIRGVNSFRYRDRNALLLQAEWRIMVNRFMDTAVFYDAGQVAAKVGQMSTRDMATSYGFGVRVHTLVNTAFRLDLAKSREGFAVVFASGAAF